MKKPVADKLSVLDRELLRLTEFDAVTVKQLCEGVLCTGQTGSGKTSGPLRNLAVTLLRQPEKLGFLIPLTKRGEVDQWMKLIKLAGREDDCVIFGPDYPARTNVLDYLYSAPDSRGSHSSDAVVNAILSLLEVRDRKRGSGGEPFWMDWSQIVIGSCTDLCGLAGETISFKNLHDLIVSMADSPEEVRSENWQKSSMANRLVDQATKRHDLTEVEKNDLDVAIDFVLHDWPRMESKTRAGILATVQSLTFGFRRGPLAQLFDGETSLTPEDIFSGAVVLLDMPVKEYEVGRLAQILWRIMFMQSSERRSLTKYPNPVIQFVDEFGTFVCKDDPQHIATARSQKVINIAACQNIDSIRSQFTSRTGNAEAECLLGNYNLKVFTANDHVQTNLWASQMTGEQWQLRSNFNANLSQLGGMSAGASEQKRFLVDPIEFMRLRKGGSENNGMVESIVFRSGRPFSNGLNHMKVRFSQG